MVRVETHKPKPPTTAGKQPAESSPIPSRTRTRRPRSNFLVTPFTILIDDREGAPYSFGGIQADTKHRGKQIIVQTETHRLATGDYTLSGCEDLVAVERKSLPDLFGSLIGDRRERLRAEFERMAAMVAAGGMAAIVVEALLEDAVFNPPPESNLHPKTVHRTWLSWLIRFPGVQWLWCGADHTPGMGSRRMAEITTFRLLEKWWALKVEGEGQNNAGKRKRNAA